MEDKCIAAITQHHSYQPGFISIVQKACGAVVVIVREDGNYDNCVTLTLSSKEFNQLVGEIIRS